MRTLVLALALALGGCMTTGVQVTEAQTQAFQKGKTTYAEVVAKLGQPSSSTALSDGTKVIAYSYVHAQARASSFIPVVGAFAGGADSHISLATFRFDQAGILQDWSVTGAQQGVITGPGAGSQPQVPVHSEH